MTEKLGLTDRFQPRVLNETRPMLLNIDGFLKMGQIADVIPKRFQ
jgi:hypothetical protein